MAGKAPILLAMALFSIGAAGLALTSADRADWGPFQPRPRITPEQRVIVVDVGTPFAAPGLDGLFSGVNGETPGSSTALLASAGQQPSGPAPTATPTPIPPLRVFGIATDDAGVSAAAATPTPPPLRIVNVASDDTEPAETPSPEPTADPTPEHEAPPAPEETPTPDPTPDES